MKKEDIQITSKMLAKVCSTSFSEEKKHEHGDLLFLLAC